MHNIPIYILWPGLFYGGAEQGSVFRDLFQSLWSSPDQALVCPAHGLNVLPMLHITDFVNYILDLCFYRPNYGQVHGGAIVVDDAYWTLGECVQVRFVAYFLSHEQAQHLYMHILY